MAVKYVNLTIRFDDDRVSFNNLSIEEAFDIVYATYMDETPDVVDDVVFDENTYDNFS